MFGVGEGAGDALAGVEGEGDVVVALAALGAAVHRRVVARSRGLAQRVGAGGEVAPGVAASVAQVIPRARRGPAEREVP